jgi:predicted nucleic acid-binding Zn finger protein
MRRSAVLAVAGENTESRQSDLQSTLLRHVYIGMEHVLSLSCPRYLEKIMSLSDTIHYLLLLSLAINENQLNLVENYVAKVKQVVQ